MPDGVCFHYQDGRTVPDALLSLTRTGAAHVAARFGDHESLNGCVPGIDGEPYTYAIEAMIGDDGWIAYYHVLDGLTQRCGDCGNLVIRIDFGKVTLLEPART